MRTATTIRKTTPVYSLLGIFLVFVWWLSACSREDPKEEDKVVAVTNIALDVSSPLTLKIGESKQLTATVTPADATNKTVTWSSSNETSCSVDQKGMVKANAVGTATIKAKAGDKEASIPVTVIALSAPVINWEPAGDTYSAQVGTAPFTKKAILSDVPGCNTVVTYSIDPASGVASINAKTGEVTPASSITDRIVTATVTATTSAVAGACLSATAHYKLTISLLPINKVTLNTDPVATTYGGESFTVKDAGCESGSPPTYAVSEGEGLVLNDKTLTINGANVNGATVSVTCPASDKYESSTTGYLVKIAKRELSLAFENPTTTMVLGSSNITTNKVKVTGLVGTDDPGAATGGIHYNSSNTGTATVDPSTGEVHAVAAGTTNITASCINPSKNYFYSAPATPVSYPLTVTAPTSTPVISWTTPPPNEIWVKDDDIVIAATISDGSPLTYEALDPTSGSDVASTLASITGDATQGYKLHSLKAGRGSVKIRVKSSSNTSVTPLEPTVAIKDWVASDFVAANYAEARQLLIGKDNNIYSTTDNYKILKVDPSGNVTTYAGTGTQGDTQGSTGGAKANATFFSPRGMAMDQYGNIYVTDLYSFRKISSAGTVTTINSATSGQPISKLQFDTNGILYGTRPSGIVKVDLIAGTPTQYAGGEGETSQGYVDGSLLNARFKSAIGLTIVSGNMYTCDFGNGLIRKIDMTAGVVSTFSGKIQDAGTKSSDDGPATEATFANLQDITADTSGHLFVIESTGYNSGTNSYSGALRRIDAAGNVKTIVRTGIDNAKSIVCDSSGNLYVGAGDSNSGYKLVKFSYQ